MKVFMEKIVSESKESKQDKDGVFSSGVRFGIVQFSHRIKEISQIEADHKKTIEKIKAMKWPMGGTNTAGALMHSRSLFPYAIQGGKKMQVIVLLTDGRASNRYLARASAGLVKRSGVRLIVVAIKGALRDPKEMCRMASFPCKSNVISTPRWGFLLSKIKSYMVTFCPGVVVRYDTTGGKKTSG